MTAPPPSEPDGRISRIRLSSQWVRSLTIARVHSCSVFKLNSPRAANQTRFAGSPLVSRVNMRSVQTHHSTHHHGSRCGRASPACPRRVSLIIAGRLPFIPSPTISVSSGGFPAVRCFGFRLAPALQASPFLRRLAQPHQPNRVHVGHPLGGPLLRIGRSRSVALHPVLPRRSYGSIPHGSSPHRNGLTPFCPPAFSGARRAARRICLPGASPQRRPTTRT